MVETQVELNNQRLELRRKFAEALPDFMGAESLRVIKFLEELGIE